MKKIISVLLSVAILFSALFTGVFVTAETATESDLGVYVDIIPASYKNITESVNDSGETVYTSSTWNDGSLVFDYVIEEDYTYQISFDFMGHNWAGNQVHSVSTVPETTTKISAKVPAAVKLGLPSTKTAWTNFTKTVKGSDLLASGGKYFVIHWSQVDPVSNFKNFKIMKLKGGSNSLIPSKLHSKVTQSIVDGELVYMGLNWQGGSMTYDYIIEEGYTYYLSFEYKGHNWAAMQGVSASTVVNNTDTINKAIDTAVSITVPHRNGDPDTDYNIVTTEIKGSDLLASGGKYFCLHWCQLGQDAYFKNISLFKVKTGEEYLKPTKLHHTALSLENGYSVYTSGSYDAGSITFDYEIEDGYIYYLSFDFKGHNWAQSQVPAASTVATTTTHINDPVSSAVKFSLPSRQTTWKSIIVALKGSDLLASGGKYLAINWVLVDPVSNYKNFRIIKTVDDGMLIPTGLKDFAYEVVDNNITWSVDVPANKYAIIGFNTDFVMEANKKYAVSFDYKYNGGSFNANNFGLAACKDTTSLSAQNISVLRKSTLPAAVNWTEGYLTIDTSFEGLITDTHKYLAVYGQTLGAVEMSFRNLKIEEISDTSEEEGLITDKKTKLYKETYEFFANRVGAQGYAKTSSTGTYAGEFIRDAAMQIMAHNAAGDTELSRKMLNYLLGAHKQGGSEFAEHVMYEMQNTSSGYENAYEATTEYYTEFIKRGTGGLGIKGENQMVGTDFVPSDDTLKGVSFYMLNGVSLGATTDLGKVTVSLRTKIDDESTIIASKTVDWLPENMYNGWKTFMFDEDVTVTPGERYYFVLQSTTASSVLSCSTTSKYRAYNYDIKNNLIWDKCTSGIMFSAITGESTGDVLDTVDNSNSVVKEIPSMSDHITAVAVKLSSAGTNGKVTASLYKDGYGENGTLISKAVINVSDIPSVSSNVEFRFDYPLFDIDMDAPYYLMLSGEGMTDSSVSVYGDSGVDGSIYYRAYKSTPSFDGKKQADGGYMIAVAWAQYIDNCPMTQEDMDFIELSYPVIKDLVNYYIDTEGYQNEWGLIFNPEIEHTREGAYWEGYNLITNTFAAQAFHMLADYAEKNGFTADAEKFAAADKTISDAINEHLVVDYNGKKIYAELYGDTTRDYTVDLENSLVVGFSYETFAPVGSGWHGMDVEIMNNTYEVYKEVGTFDANGYTEILDNCTYLTVTADENDCTNILSIENENRANHSGHISGKLFGWELIFCNYIGDTDRLDYLTDFVASLYKEKCDRYIYFESFHGDPSFEIGGSLSDRGNQENAGMQLYGMSLVFPDLTKVKSGDVNLDGKVNILDLVALKKVAAGDKNETVRSNIDGLYGVNGKDLTVLRKMLIK